MAKNPTTSKGQNTKAKTTAKKISKPVRKSAHVVRTKPRFYRPKTQTQKRAAKVLKHLRTHISTGGAENPHKILLQPLSSDKNMAKMEKENTVTFLVDSHANKVQIRHAFSKLYETKVRSVNTLIRPDGKKKAFIRLAQGTDALKVANKIGIL